MTHHYTVTRFCVAYACVCAGVYAVYTRVHACVLMIIYHRRVIGLYESVSRNASLKKSPSIARHRVESFPLRSGSSAYVVKLFCSDQGELLRSARLVVIIAVSEACANTRTAILSFRDIRHIVLSHDHSSNYRSISLKHLDIFPRYDFTFPCTESSILFR